MKYIVERDLMTKLLHKNSEAKAVRHFDLVLVQVGAPSVLLSSHDIQQLALKELHGCLRNTVTSDSQQ